MGKHERIARGAVASFKYGQMRLFVITEPAGKHKADQENRVLYLRVQNLVPFWFSVSGKE